MGPKQTQILVVEDDPVIRDVLEQLLQYQGYKTAGAPNGKDALDQLRAPEVAPSLMILDLMMPVMNGLELLGILRADPSYCSLPVILLSAGAEPVQLPAGAHTRFLRKPLRMQSLLEVVRELI